MIRSTALIASILLCAGGLLALSPAPAALADAIGMATTTEPANEVCPIKGNEVDRESPTRQFEGVTIGFCCPGCEGKWDKKTDGEKMALLAKHAPEAVVAINSSAPLVPAFIGMDYRVEAGLLQSNPALAAARGYLAACARADAAALNTIFLDKDRATVSENASDEGTWETYREHHLMPELKGISQFGMTLTKEDTQVYGTTTIVRHFGSFTVPDPNHRELTTKYLAAITYVVVDEAGTPKIAHLHWSSRADRKAEPAAPATPDAANGANPGHDHK